MIKIRIIVPIEHDWMGYKSQSKNRLKFKPPAIVRKAKRCVVQQYFIQRRILNEKISVYGYGNFLCLFRSKRFC